MLPTSKNSIFCIIYNAAKHKFALLLYITRDENTAENNMTIKQNTKKKLRQQQQQQQQLHYKTLSKKITFLQETFFSNAQENLKEITSL